MRAAPDDDADAATIGITTWEAIGSNELAPGDLEVMWTSPPYCHCNFTALDSPEPSRAEAWVARLLEMDWDNRGCGRSGSIPAGFGAATSVANGTNGT